MGKERFLVIDRLKLSYEGLFNVAEVYAVIVNFFYEKGWDYYEKVNQELVTPQGKQFRFVIQNWKSMSDFFKITMQIKMNFFDVKEVEVEVDGQTLRMSQGLVRIMIDGHIILDRKGWWGAGPLKSLIGSLMPEKFRKKHFPNYNSNVFSWFLMLLMTKSYFTQHYSQAEEWLESDVSSIYDLLKSYLNGFNYRYKNNPSDTHSKKIPHVA